MVQFAVGQPSRSCRHIGVAVKVHGAWCDPADLDRLLRLWATRVLNVGGSLRFRHWRLYGGRGLAGQRAAVWVHGEALTAACARSGSSRSSPPATPRRKRTDDGGHPALFILSSESATG